MYNIDRIFSTENKQSGAIEWYFRAREGLAGPYASRVQAELVLKKFIKTCIELGQKGGTVKILDLIS